MSELAADLQPKGSRRCPTCDYAAGAAETVCLMCGAALPPVDPTAVSVPDSTTPPPDTAVSPPVTEPAPESSPVAASPMPDVVTAAMRERQAPMVLGLTAVFTVIIVV